MEQFRGRVCVVSGGTRGIGRSVVERLHAEGATVVALGRDREAGRALEDAFPGCAFRAVDVADATQVRSSIDAVIEEHGGIDHVVCAAGITRDALVLRTRDEDWQELLGVNLSGTFHVIQAALRSMLRRSNGSIVAVSSVVGETGNAGQAAYAASKAGICGFCRSLAKEIAGRGVRVNVVAPGFVETDMTVSLPEDVRAAYLARTPLRRAAQPHEIASVIVFLLSPQASYITGQVVGVNGGLFP